MCVYRLFVYLDSRRYSTSADDEEWENARRRVAARDRRNFAMEAAFVVATGVISSTFFILDNRVNNSPKSNNQEGIAPSK